MFETVSNVVKNLDNDIILPIHFTIFKERNSHCNFFKKYISGRESFKDTHSLHLPNERFSPVRRASDSLTSMNKYQTHLEKIYNLSLSTPSSRHNSLKQLQKECQQLSVSAREHCVNLFRKTPVGAFPELQQNFLKCVKLCLCKNIFSEYYIFGV